MKSIVKTPLVNALKNNSSNYRKASIFTAIFSLSLSANADMTAPPMSFNAGQGNHTVIMTGKIITMGTAISVPKSIVKKVKMPKNEAEFCAAVKAQNYETVTTKVTTCTFNNGKGKLAGTMNIMGTQSTFDYNYSFQ